MWGILKQLQNNQVSETALPVASTSEAFHSSVTFPTPWTMRIQTPIARVPSGKMWSQPERYVPKTYGGPQ